MDVAPLTLGQLLLAENRITAEELEKALTFQAQFGGRLGSILVRLGAISEDNLLPVLADQTGYTVVAAGQLPAPQEVADFVAGGNIGLDWLLDRRALLWEGPDGTVHCAARDPLSASLQENVSIAYPSRTLAWHFARAQDLERLAESLQRAGASATDEVGHLRELAEEAPVIELANNILAQALDQNASDIHLEPEEQIFHVRFRVDGLLYTAQSMPRDRFDALASRVKLVSGMDIAERRLPQDGRISIRASGTDIDIRVSAVPGVHGESIVLRLLPKERADLRLERLGMESDQLSQFRRWLTEPHGIVLVTGPTGSGKSTTLYAALDASNDGKRKIITVEDPVEFKLPGVTQIQAHSEIGYTFARALRAILRQDPDVIMVGEIRDLETAEIAIQAALTGHMVFSTLHTNDAISAFTRLLDMGVEPFLVASSLRAVLAQRLVRKLCPQCAAPAEPSALARQAIERIRAAYAGVIGGEARWRAPVGCGACFGTGYRGRTGIYEFVEVSPEMQVVVMKRASVREMMAVLLERPYRSLRDDGLIKAYQGITSIEEVLRVAGAGEEP